MAEEELIVPISADTQAFETALKNLEKQASSFGTTLTGALKSAIVSGKSLEDTLRSIALTMAGSALSDGFAPLQNLINGFGKNLLAGAMPITAHAKGGVVNSPTYFPNGNTIGLMGEAGSEAILPLKRTTDGSLGVTAGDSQSGHSNITVNITTPDVAGFNRSSPQISAALARAVARGRRSS